jgi:hypothetical protein
MKKNSFEKKKFDDPGIGLTGDRVEGPGKRFKFRSVRCALDGP